jgi:hypothetical protein
MVYLDAFKGNTQLIGLLGEGGAHLVWSLGLYLEEPDLQSLASESLTDGPNDKKIDFILLDRDAKRIVFAQGYYGTAKKDSAPSNKAADLNTAGAWLVSGNVSEVPEPLRPVIEECRAALAEGDVEAIELLYVHNFPESVNVTKELQTASSHLRKALGDGAGINVIARELGSSGIENLFASQESHIDVKDEVVCPAKAEFLQAGPKWSASIMSIPGIWLHELFSKYGDRLFSANYRGFLGITKRRRINTQIRSSAESQGKDFWVFNNGITLLTLGANPTKEGTRLTGISIINGAQTTGSIGTVDLKRHDLKDVRVLCRIIQCSDSATISDIVKYNNTQNEITTWDQYSNDPDQNRIAKEFEELGVSYARKRGFRVSTDEIGIEDVVQPLIAFHGKYRDANRGKNLIFERKPLYTLAFDGKKARHILFVYALTRAIDERRIELKKKSTEGSIITIEEEQLALLRNLRFKAFFVAVVSKALETVLARKIDPETVAFSPDAAKASNNSLVALVAAWSPVVDAVLSFLVTQVSAAEFSKKFAEDGYLDGVAKAVAGFLYASKGTLSFKDFAALVSDS